MAQIYTLEKKRMSSKIIILALAGGAAYLLLKKTTGNVSVITQAVKNVEFDGLSFYISGGEIKAILKVAVTNVSKNELTISGLKAYIQANGSLIATVEPSAQQLAAFNILPESRTTIPVPVNIKLGAGVLAVANLSSIKSLNVNGIAKIEGFPDFTLQNYSVPFDGAALVETVVQKTTSTINTAKDKLQDASNSINDVRLSLVQSAITSYKKENPSDTVQVYVDESLFSQTLNTYYFIATLNGSGVKMSYKISLFGGYDIYEGKTSDVEKLKKISV